MTFSFSFDELLFYAMNYSNNSEASFVSYLLNCLNISDVSKNKHLVLKNKLRDFLNLDLLDSFIFAFDYFNAEDLNLFLKNIVSYKFTTLSRNLILHSVLGNNLYKYTEELKFNQPFPLIY